MRFYNFAPNFIFRFVVSLILLSYFRSQITVCSADEEGYNGTIRYSYNESTLRGPSRWGQLDPNWFLCGNGTRQSPININASTVQLRPQLGGLQTNYSPAPATLFNRGNEIEVNWNGSDAGNLTVNGTVYKLLECHWHTPSEHRLNGRRFDMEIHLVHKNDRGEIAVVGILYKYMRWSKPDPFLSSIYQQILSLRNGTKQIPLGIVNPRDIESPGRRWRSYYRYNGSLTTPPCAENVLWTVLKRVQTVSPKQVQALQEAVDDGFEENARPTQPLNGRKVSLYSRWFF
ncbi:alpha carbonic anhydrase 4 [Morus notabilis]|nr:alpha carbonic anhydrase 4 [Morus notabilis]